jgi:two-component system, chemotaxis family, protein-glutamate methylesterase/glutaminase
VRRDIIVIGASAGGVNALRTLFASLPADLGASVFVVLHTSPESPGLLAEILNYAGALRATTVRSIERIQVSKVYVAPPDHHMIIEPGWVRATKGPKENRCRPAVDPLFRSAGQTYGPRVIGVVLTGGLDDGAAGLWAVKHLGGTAVVQDPRDAYAESMPRNALQRVEVDHCVPLSEMPALLVRLVSEAGDDRGEIDVPKHIEIEVDIAKAENALHAGVLEWGDASKFACPECHGVLLQLKEGNRIRFRCHTGHAYSPASLMADMNEAVEDALWNAVRCIQESALLMEHLAEHAAGSHGEATAGDLRLSAQSARKRAELVRQAVLEHSYDH